MAMMSPTKDARRGDGGRAAETAVPEQLVSIGSWALLAELRRLFVRELDRFLRPKAVWNKTLDRLIKESIGEWKRVYQDPQLAAHQGQLDELVGYLENRRARLSELVPEPMLESLILPYLMACDPQQKELRWWYPDDAYLTLYYDSVENSSDSGTAHPPLYPILSRDTLRSLRDSEGLTQLLAEDVNFRERLASGMRSFQTKLIGSFNHMYNPESWREDQLVGNGSGYLHALRADDDTELGTLFFCTPVFGLFYEILHGDDCGPEEHRANWICPRHVDAIDHQLQDRFPFHHPGAGEKHTTIFVCQGDCRKIDGGHCFFDAVDRRVAPPARSFLAGLQAMATRAELDQARRLLRKVTHTLSGPLIAAQDRYERMIESLPDDLSQEVRTEIDRFGTTAVVVSHLCELNRTWLRRIDRNDGRDPRDSRRRPRVASASTDLEELISLLKDLDLFRQLTGPATHIDWDKPVQEPRRVKGSRGTWISVFFTLLANAARATEDADGSEIQLHRTYDDDYHPEDQDRWLRLEISNPSPPLSKERLQEMRACLTGHRDGMDPDPKDPDSMGVGLAIVGHLLRELGAETSIDQTDGRICIRIRCLTR